MATILLSAAGAAVGAGFGGTVLGLSGAVIGRAVGATLGRAIDQRLMGAGSAAVEHGRIDRLRLTGASEGAGLGMVWGRMRVAGQVIWASPFAEHVTRAGGGKGAPRPASLNYSYSVSLAIALCEGEITRIGRIWADGAEIAPDSLNLRVYTGSEDQLPDPRIAAVEGAENAPAYRGTAYVVIEDLELAPYGNRVPQFTFEVMRRARGATDLAAAVQGVALIPGSGEYALATTAVHLDKGLGVVTPANTHTPAGGTDFAVSLRMLDEELPACGSVSLVVSWFSGDLRCGAARLRPKVESRATDGAEMPWVVSGLARAAAPEIAQVDGRPVYGGTPADASVIEAIRALRGAGKAVVFYPFVLMDQLAGNGLPDPYGGAEQAHLPWRGRITLSAAPGRAGSPDGTAAADAEVAAFFGAAQPGQFAAAGDSVVFSGSEWSYRRFILHYAHLCAAAGGVAGFCVGSELRGLTQARGAAGFPAVAALAALVAEVKAILGPDCKVGYAADWTEYAGYQTPEGDLRFPLDPLWAVSDFVGIDNYMPLSDWRAGEDHADAHWGAIHNLDYLRANIEGGEGYDWYYESPEHRAAQIRTPITDGLAGEPWVWRVKDIRNWWQNPHHERIGGVRQAVATPWMPQSKPVWFTEYGCAAVDKGTNEPNKFLDPKSSESSLPVWSDGRRDDLIQMQYLRAITGYWAEPGRNPVSQVYGGPMLDLARAHVWAWDARPYPAFPNDLDSWSDGLNYPRGHWLNGRATAQPLADVVAEICARAGLGAVDTAGLNGTVTGYQMAEVDSARAALQPLMLAYGFEAVERGGTLAFRMRDGRATARVAAANLVQDDSAPGAAEVERAAEAALAGRVRLTYVSAEGDYEARAAEAVFPDESATTVAHSEFPLALTAAEAQRTVERWLAEARVARDGARFALPPSLSHLGAGDVVEIDLGAGARRYRLDRIEDTGAIAVQAVRVEPAIYQPSDEAEARIVPRAFVPPVPVLPVFLDLPLIRGDEVPHAPYLAVTATPWPGSVAVHDSDQDAGYALNRLIAGRAVVGRSLTPLPAAAPGRWDRGPALRVQIAGGALASAGLAQVLNGANLMAIGDGSPEGWELLQFARADLVAEGVYDLSLRLRGQAGTDAFMPEVWPEGATVVLLDGAPQQIRLAASQRGLARHYRIGTAARPYDDPSYRHVVAAFAGAGLRPYAPCHLRATESGGDLVLRWTRRTRIDGDSWQGIEVPLGEAQESYLVRVTQGGAVVRQDTAAAPLWTYSAALRAADALTGAYAIEIAQLSDAFGAGPFARIDCNG